MKLIDRLLKTKTGGIILSILFGLAIPTLFRRVCMEEHCKIIESDIDEIKKKVYKNDNECYRFEPVLVECKSKNKK